jgi:hypothetical protein
MQILKEKKKKKNEENEERRRLEDEINKDKQIMMDRLQYIIKSDGEYTKEEINDYVFKGIKPKKKNKEEQSKSEENEKEEKEENNNNNNPAFITSLKQ